MITTYTRMNNLRSIILICLLTVSFLSSRAQGRVLINEYLPWPSNGCGTTAEFIELFNFGPGPVNIGGYIVTDGEYSITIPRNTILPANQYYVLAGQNTILQNCGNDTRNVAVNLNWTTCGCTSTAIPTTGDGLLTDGGSSNDQIVLLDSNLVVIDAIVRSTPVEASVSVTTSSLGGQFTPRSFDLDNMGIQYEAVGESAGRGNSFARKVDGGCGWLKDTHESAGDRNNTTGQTLSWNATLSLTQPYDCTTNGSVVITVSDPTLFPMQYTLARDKDSNEVFDENDQYFNGVDNTASNIPIGNLAAGSYRLAIVSTLGCDATQLDFSILGCSARLLNQSVTADQRNGATAAIRLLGNPFDADCKLSINGQKKGKWCAQVYDQLGRQVRKQELLIQTGQSDYALPMHTLKAGVYIIRLTNETGEWVASLKGQKR
ncbi:lamin tail domain-containing protein [Paraflavitalea sp. CAU 1676]|uniref:lamin tail domain-containing protein n=1 Tax=Paraflavitalea sp. CAU 1676 TaxID=3032598 RepID=UPI0023D9B4CA|nr:lamin tail domain-containing protein [Paraflavitalea sp. CAU 1676]MDF2188979.1 lamin tail domain-containing protein [Paraflavitalea sp. CAU 1676]